jgi:hypothetical protein
LAGLPEYLAYDYATTDYHMQISKDWIILQRVSQEEVDKHHEEIDDDQEIFDCYEEFLANNPEIGSDDELEDFEALYREAKAGETPTEQSVVKPPAKLPVVERPVRLKPLVIERPVPQSVKPQPSNRLLNPRPFPQSVKPRPFPQSVKPQPSNRLLNPRPFPQSVNPN